MSEDLQPQETPRRRGCLGRWAKRAALGLLVLLVIGALVVVWLVRRPWPQTDGRLELAGLERPVEVVRDRWGVPHVRAQTEHDLFFAQGFVHAQDRFWQLEFNRRLGSGRLSEVLGQGTLGFDRFMRTLGLAQDAREDFDRAPEVERRVLEAYAAGVNAYLDTHGDRLPLEFTLLGFEPEPWEPTDSLVWSKVMGWILSENHRFELTRAQILGALGEAAAQELLPPYPQGAPVVVPAGSDGYSWLVGEPLEGLQDVADLLGDPGPDYGSNNWVIAPQRTATGGTLLANDTHLELLMPSVWYQVGLHQVDADGHPVPGGYRAVGSSFPGVPLVLLGHNGRIAWGVTDMIPDVQDLYLERLDDPDQPTRYQNGDHWLPLEVRREEIRVKGRSEPEVLEVRSTRRGPLINHLFGSLQESEPTSLAWTLEDGLGMIDSLHALNRASDWEEFRTALARWNGPSLNFVYADTAGNIGYQAAGQIPIRPDGHQGLLPMPAWTGEADWVGRVPFDQLPRRYNPPEGFIVTANNKLVDDDYPYHLAYEWSDPYRAVRLTDLLDDADDLTVDDMVRLQGDTYSEHAETVAPALVALADQAVEAGAELDAVERDLVEAVRGWNLSNETASAGAAAFQVWYRHLLEATLADELDEDLFREYRRNYWIHGPMIATWLEEPAAVAWFDDVTTEGTVETAADTALAALSVAADWLTEAQGADPAGWRWGAIHTATATHRPLGQSGVPLVERLFNGPTVEAPGDRFSVNAAWFNFRRSEPYSISGGTALRLVIDLADFDRSLAVHNTGQSAHLFHPHRDDLQALWAEMEYHPLLFTETAIDAAATDRLVLAPSATQEDR